MYKMLADEKIIELYSKHLTLHPSFAPVLDSNILQHRNNIMNAILYSVMSYCPTLSPSLVIVISDFVSKVILKGKNVAASKQLEIELNIAKNKKARMLQSSVFQNVN